MLSILKVITGYIPNSNYLTILIMKDQDACCMLGSVPSLYAQLNFQQAQEFLAIETYVLGRER